MKSRILNKINLFILLMVLAIFILSSCVGPIGANFRLSQGDNAIVSIEIVEVEDKGFIESDYFFDDFKAIKVIEEGMWEQFLSDFRELEYYKYYYEPLLYITGIAFCITYEDGSFDLIDDTSVYYYDKKKKKGYYTNYFFDLEPFEELENKYLYI